MMMEPVNFHANQQTKETNSYQHDDNKNTDRIQKRARAEFRAFRDLLVENGVAVTSVQGQEGCPDDIFCNNWISTHAGKRMVLYPMLAENRQRERRKDLIDIMRKTYTDVQDFTAHEQQGKALESTGAICMDRVNKIGYQAISARSNIEVGAMWCKMNGFEHVPIHTEHLGKPVYHADVVMWIGTSIAGITTECVRTEGIVKRLKEHRDVIEFSNDQMAAFCGNSLEVVNKDGERMLVMSRAGFKKLHQDQKDQLWDHYNTIIQPEIPTIEYYGGGSARCMLLELF
jgi:hypothetical protein